MVLVASAMILLSNYRLWLLPEKFDPRYAYRWLRPFIGLSTLGTYYLVLAALLTMRYNVFQLARWTGWVVAAALLALLPASCIPDEDGVPILILLFRPSLMPVAWLVLLVLQILLARTAARALETRP